MLVYKIALLLVYVYASFGGPLPPYHLKCQGALVGLSPTRLLELEKQKLLVVDDPLPVLSWTLMHSDRAPTQSAFQVILAEDKFLVKVYWDTGKVHNEENAILYNGPELTTGKTYFWKVKWWDNNGQDSISEETGHFLTGVLDVKEWNNAKWIAADDSIKTAPYIYKTFRINPGGEGNATVFIAGLGFQKVFINGEDVHSKFDPPVALAPGWTNYEKLVPYSAYSVPFTGLTTNLTIGVILGGGWRNVTDYPLKDPGGIPESDSVERVLKVYVIYYDYSMNTSAYLVSDGSWSVNDSYITSDSIYRGETFSRYLGREPMLGSPVRVVAGPNGSLYAPMVPYIAEMGVELPIKTYYLETSATQVADFGNNSAGYCRVYCDDEPSYSVKHAEVPLHPPYGPKNGSLYYGNLKLANATDSYDGVVETTHKPSFTYHGFRYAEVSGFVRMSITARNFQKIVVHSNVARNSKFHTSNPLLNNIQENCIRSQLSNLMSVITDCDQRSERIGWLGDASLSAKTMSLNFDMHAFYLNFLLLISTELIDGVLPDVVPFYHGGRRPADPSWSAAFPEILYRVSFYNNDMNTAEKYYSDVFKYIVTTANTIPKDNIQNFPNCHYGDWVPPPPQQKVSNAFTGISSFLISINQTMEIARLLNKTDDVALLEKTFEDIIQMYNSEFMTNGNQYLNGIQPTFVLPLAVGAVPSSNMVSFVKTFLNRLESTIYDKSHVAGGIVTTRYLFPVLSQLKQHDLALKIASQLDYPSYGWMIHNNLEPSTTIWEHWDSSESKSSSRNHHMFSSISGWMLTDMVGLSIHKGFEKVMIFPANSLGLSYASVSLQHPKPVNLSWQRNGGIQCGKQAENQSPLHPDLPKHNDLTVSCGDENGGIIQKVLFSSFGNPSGHCSGYHKKGSCHADNSMEITQNLCLGKRSCTIPTTADYWDNPCPGLVKWLMVEVQCKPQSSETENLLFTSIEVNITIPLGSRGYVHFPAYGQQNLKLIENRNVVFPDFNLKQPGILSTQWEFDSDSLLVELETGIYNFIWKGENFQRQCLDSDMPAFHENLLLLRCINSTDIISSITWASFGTPQLTFDNDCFSHILGDCHAGSSKYAIERECIGKKSCVVKADEDFFGDSFCLEGSQYGRLIVEYTCNTC